MQDTKHTSPIDADNDAKRRNVHGRRLGRPLSPARKHALDELLPTLKIAEEQYQTPAQLEPLDLFTDKTSRALVSCDASFLPIFSNSSRSMLILVFWEVAETLQMDVFS